MRRPPCKTQADQGEALVGAANHERRSPVAASGSYTNGGNLSWYDNFVSLPIVLHGGSTL